MKWFRKNIANILSFTRIILTPLLIYLALNGYNRYFVIFFLTAIGTDAIDGTVARIFKAESKLGQILDTIADYIFFPSTLITFLYVFRAELTGFYYYIAFPVVLFFIPKAIAIYYTRQYPYTHLRSWQIATYPVSIFLIVSFISGFNIKLLLICNLFALFGCIEESLVYLIQKNKINQKTKSIFELIKFRRI
jgi:cardiolipin synthase (CMP-forming)